MFSLEHTTMIIYKITNTINGKCYIGQTQHTFNRRYERNGVGAERVLACYEFSKDRGDSYNIHLYRSMKKYGVENFTVEILEQCKTVAKLNSREKYYIKLYNSADPDFGYNYQLGGGSTQCTAKMRKYKQEQKRLDEINETSFIYNILGQEKVYVKINKPCLQKINSCNSRAVYILICLLSQNNIHEIDITHLCKYVKTVSKRTRITHDALLYLQQEQLINFSMNDNLVLFNIIEQEHNYICELHSKYYLDLVQCLLPYTKYLNKPTKIITCKNCGRCWCVAKNANNTKYCDPCKKQVRNEQAKNSRKKKENF
jgi:group I intron endonuclease